MRDTLVETFVSLNSVILQKIMQEDRDEEIKLPDDTLAILNQFLDEKAKQDKEELFAENWNLSQFW